MSRFIGPIRQIGYVVHDLDAWLRYFTGTVGVGPFIVAREIRIGNFHYMGAPAASPCVSLAFGQSGPLQIEVIAQHDDLPSGYRDFLDSGHEGAQHLAAWFADNDSYDRAHKRLRDQGLFVRHESTAEPRFAYFSRGDGVYPELEIAEALLPWRPRIADYLAQQSEGWDGRNPVRALDGTPDPLHTE
jgi:catechol 2,3-dioxygenase-like lactoylglutathione lyase family enzyme